MWACRLRQQTLTPWTWARWRLLRQRVWRCPVWLTSLEAALEALLARNAQARREHSDPSPAQRISLPFILVQTQAGKPVEVSHSEDLQHVHMDFNDSQFSIHDDAYVLNALHLVPPVLHG